MIQRATVNFGSVGREGGRINSYKAGFLIILSVTSTIVPSCFMRSNIPVSVFLTPQI